MIVFECAAEEGRPCHGFLLPGTDNLMKQADTLGRAILMFFIYFRIRGRGERRIGAGQIELDRVGLGQAGLRRVEFGMAYVCIIYMYVD